ncbi:cyclic pyranopterin phosphate synthase [Corynebacterium sp. HMSC074C04]|uniref:GTP 3',8-cyclase MoaA n=1 Tax=Corynebacterium sp. HMSC074C04 TaxID=1739514 RepID=UPI0008A9194B|nr:GTP 3',8-cyclase MoaA [Corynebacterium sp. HMSC074C04]OHR37353.1 cyclic pyranopterin phosphate synthase [Corynebacterium sp. HMSC074C04]
MTDKFERTIRDLRFSLTDRCNLRCVYCMPEEGADWIRRDDILTDEEIIRLIRIATSRLGITMVRFTGGEPLLRKSLEKLIAATPVSTAITTNGLGLVHRAQSLKDAGLDRVTVSLDSVNSEVFSSLTRRDRLDDVLAGLDAAVAAGLQPVKVNSVVMPGVNNGAELKELANYFLAKGLELRFIEQMPLGPPAQWDRDIMVKREDILATLETEFELSPAETPRGSAPAEVWQATSRKNSELNGKIGVIASVTQPFCGNCDRTRITADGAVRNCLFANSEVSLRDVMRAGGTDDEVIAAWRRNTWAKLPGHGIDEPGFLQPKRNMSAIGG